MDRFTSLINMDLIEQEAQNQIYNILSFDFVKHLAVMPDVHAGYTLPIGGVALMDKVISPECVGVDIGCGMCMLETDIDMNDVLNEKQRIYDAITKMIPTGFRMHSKAMNYHDFRLSTGDKVVESRATEKLYKQLGTLGGGNHFIELGYNNDGKICITVYSGSRGAGNIVAEHYISLSKQRDKDLPDGFLHLESETGLMYRADLAYFTQYALDNRLAMIESIRKVLSISQKHVIRFVNENHNFADIMADGMVRHRKGATPAELGQIGIIPANMRDGVFVTEGLGNAEYLSSASHGAGRKMGRKEAKRRLTIEDFRNSMPSHIKANISQETLDEAPDAYKDINEVIAAQDGINIKVIDRIMPLINVKGAEG